MSGAQVVGKVFVTGSMVEAERELAMGQLAAGPGVVTYRATTLDAATNRPCVTTSFELGTDLDRLVAEQGALPAALVCRLLLPVAETLARLHALRSDLAPAGLCHGDVKPKNLLRTPVTTLLLDFEHAQPIRPSPKRLVADATFTGGSHGFAPPEARLGAPPDAAFDVYGLGACLRWLLQGGPGVLLPQPRDLAALVASCMESDPVRRPTAADIARTLTDLEPRLDQDQDEATLDDWASGRLQLGSVAAVSPTDRNQRLWHRRHRLTQRLVHLLEIPSALPTEPASLLRELKLAGRVLARFPRHLPSLRWRRDLRHATGAMLAAAAQHGNAMARAEEFEHAEHWLCDLAALVLAVRCLPGGCPIPGDETPATVGLLHRDPIAFLERLGDQLAAARQELGNEQEAITAAERQLDLRAAERAVEQMAAHYGGASPTAARRRDQLHRLGFYLDRVARAEANVERVGPLWDAVALKPLADLVTAAATACQRHTRSEVAGGAVGLRSLQITLVNLAEEFPHLQQVTPALDALTQALAHLTDQAWALLADAQQKLRAVPVPVRPLQLALGRLDTYRLLEAFVDRSERPRSQLQDGIEALRLSLEQARATRDRLAEGAENAVARGHWTTGLFDMERAVAGLNPGDDHERAEAARLKERVEAVRRRKQEVDAAVRRNVELASLYGTLQDDPSSTFAGRLQVLDERRDCLLFLTMHVPAERGVLYGGDLRDVETQIALEQAGLAEHQLDGTVDPDERLRLSRSTLERLSSSTPATEQGVDPPGRMVRLFEHWRTVTAHCQRAVDQVHAEQAARQRQRRRFLAMAIGALLVCATAIGLAVRPWFVGHSVSAGERTVRLSASELAERAQALPAELRDDAQGLRTAALLATKPGPFDHRAWHDTFRVQLVAFVDRLQAASAREAAVAFAVACWDTGLAAAHERLDAGNRTDLLRLTNELVNALPVTGLRPSTH